MLHRLMAVIRALTRLRASRRGLSVSAAIRLIVRENASGIADNSEETRRRFLGAAGAIRGGTDEGDVLP